MKNKSKRGGPRQGAGRPTPDGAHGLIKKNVMLDQVSIDKFLKQGNGNLSLGAREAAKLLGVDTK